MPIRAEREHVLLPTWNLVFFCASPLRQHEPVLPPQSADAYTRFRGPVSWQLLVLRPSLDVNSFAFLSNKTNTYLTYLRTYLAESSPNTEEHQVVCVCARIIICAAEKFGQAF